MSMPEVFVSPSRVNLEKVPLAKGECLVIWRADQKSPFATAYGPASDREAAKRLLRIVKRDYEKGAKIFTAK